ncbi:TrbC/VirB2 family protein [Candidatus Anaplasma sp. TIGMIC]|uniref:TrbC/VirB2 family protein n=1 Tax=Candidatus Anaplasma sp. TIGMIC TaxID=3020713 RepID=UPI0023310BC7|nr:TrbC/VirB2 family protein [Candidatus Anaplasma sp. TIGMIC]MDB1135673.1 TrbC/VirB2 family protein [Candidatus Anaplasma sp. TIGMIC]
MLGFAGFCRYACLVFVALFLINCVSCGNANAGETGPAAGAAGKKDTTVQVICNVVNFVQKLGLPIMTGVILGSSIMAIFGRLAWPAIAVLVVFTAIFFGASKIMTKFASGVSGMKDDKFSCSTDKN